MDESILPADLNEAISVAQRILSIVGARPQFIKAAAVSRVLRATRGMREVLVHTGQHYDPGMSGVFFRELEIPRPDRNLGIGSGGHGAQTGRMLEGIERVLTNPTLSAELRTKGMARAREFSWERSVARTRELYQEVGGRS